MVKDGSTKARTDLDAGLVGFKVSLISEDRLYQEEGKDAQTSKVPIIVLGSRERSVLTVLHDLQKVTKGKGSQLKAGSGYHMVYPGHHEKSSIDGQETL